MNKFDLLMEQIKHKIAVYQEMISRETDNSKRAAFRFTKKDLEELVKSNS